LSNAEIGALFAAPVLAQVPLNLAGGAYTDRIGGGAIMLGSCWATVVAGVWPHVRPWVLDADVWQIALVLSRAAFWPATWAMASELPGAAESSWDASTRSRTWARSPYRVVRLPPCGGRFMLTFATLAAVGLVAFFAGLGTRQPRAGRPPAGIPCLPDIWRLLHQRIIQ